MSPETFLSERKGEVIPVAGPNSRKGEGPNSGESGARNLDAESITEKPERRAREGV